jgi:DEAD/DEAH box helicase domain-containing protein
MMRLKGINIAEGIHAAQHAFLNRFAMAADVKTECKPAEKEYARKQTSRKRPARLIFYDTAGKTGSVAVRAFDHGPLLC